MPVKIIKNKAYLSLTRLLFIMRYYSLYIFIIYF